MAKPIMIQGTMSNAGKSILAGGLCRVLHQDGYRVAPFKSQNMALNSYITKEGLEMGRAQAMQAEAAGIEPSVLMNPILLKPTSDMGSQVILNGEVKGVMSAAEYYRQKKEYLPVIRKAYDELARNVDVIVVEGAGSPAEINLKDQDIVNMGMAELIDAPVLLVGDIDRGGVFAQIVGTIALLEEQERKRIKGTIINKFRGDIEILKPGLKQLEENTRVPVCGVIPYFHLDIDDEDSLSERLNCRASQGRIEIAVIRFPRISNFTDLLPLESAEGVTVRYVTRVTEFGNPDAVILPGSKNTMEDLRWLRECGLEARIIRHAQHGKVVFGICGGYQMMGEEILDPDHAEAGGTMRGMGLLPVRTIFAPQKIRTRVEGAFGSVEGILRELSKVPLEGYEIHMGRTEYTGGGKPLVSLQEMTKDRNAKADGAQRKSCYGCYIHGIFDHSEVVRTFAGILLKQKGYDPSCVRERNWKQYKEEQYDQLAEIIRTHLDMDMIYEMAGRMVK